MIGLGPHEMDAWLWGFNVGLTVVLVVLTLLSLRVAVRATRAGRGTSNDRGVDPLVRLDAADGNPRAHREARS